MERDRFEDTRTDVTKLNLKKVSETVLIESIPTMRAKGNKRHMKDTNKNLIILLTLISTILLAIALQFIAKL